MEKFTDQSKEVLYILQSEADFLSKFSDEICKDNNCDLENENHNCESFAYYDIKITDENEILDLNRIDVCLPDYLTKTVDIAIPMPIKGNAENLFDLLLSNITKEEA